MNFFAALLASIIVKPLQKAASYLLRQKDGTVAGTSEAQAAAPLIDQAAQSIATDAGARIVQAAPQARH